MAYATHDDFIDEFGSVGNASGQFFEPSGVAIDSIDRIMVADVFNNRIQVFDSSGNCISTFGSIGTSTL